MRVVGGDRPHLEREDGVGLAREHQLAHRLDRLTPALQRHEVLELVEVGVELARIDAVAAIDAATWRGVVGQVVPGLVVDLDVAGVRHPLPGRRGQPVELGRGLARQPEEREVAVPGEQRVPVGQHVAERPVLDALAQPVGGADLDRHARHDAEHPDRDLGGPQQVGPALVDLHDLAVPVDEPARAHGRREARQGCCPSHACRSRWHRRWPACRCRPGWRARALPPRAGRRTRRRSSRAGP